MHNELRYQVRIHAISNKPRKKKKVLQILPKIIIIIFIIKKQKKTTSNMEKTSYAKA